MPELTASQLAQVDSFPKLVALLRDHLEWPINEDYEFEDVIFEYEPQELGLKDEETAKVREIHQLRPLVTNQPWGVFFISFEEKQLSVTVLRRILRALVVKQRGSAAHQKAWDRGDLIFAANFGKSGERELAFVHFSDGADTGDLPVMKVLGWNAKDTKLHNNYAANMLTSRLAWPDEEGDDAAWRKQWSGAFEIGHRQVIKTSRDLALHLAGLATQIRARANELLEAEADDGPIRTMLEAFRKNLIHDLDADGFADMFAQTICYGMLAAAISRPSGALVADNMADMVPRTNPFLKELFANFLKLGGRDKRSNLDFDELGVREVVDMLQRADMPAVLRDFGDRNPKEDPVIHFYELFLKEYDPAKRMQRGVFYTPRPVVNFIVRGVDEILRTKFDLPLGLADTTTWGELAARNDRITVPDHIDPDQPFVQILDPATGTGTFLVEVIDLIHKRMVEHWQGEGKSNAAIAEAWNEYVPAHLLPRLTAFELMMAPYAIAHMKIGLKLSETGYKFGSDERAHIFLTNALEPAQDLDMQFDFMSTALAHEAEAANLAKGGDFTVAIGNPPYSGISRNMGSWIQDLIKGRGRTDPERKNYYAVDGSPLGERKVWLQDDYVKFIRLSQFYIDRTSCGILGLISNHGYLDNPTFRGMRNSLISTFNLIDVIDLHGNSRKGETKKPGEENVFEIEQGVAIAIMTCLSRANSAVCHSDLWGASDAKLDALARDAIDFEKITPVAQTYLFVPESEIVDPWYESLSSLTEVFPVNGSGIITARDRLAVHFDDNELRIALKDFCDPTIDDDIIRNQFKIGDNYAWKMSEVRKSLSGQSSASFMSANMTYRPFDRRLIAYHSDIVFRPKRDLMKHMLELDNVGLISTRQTKDPWDIKASGDLVAHKSLSAYDINSLFPLWLLPDGSGDVARPNIQPAFIRVLEECLSAQFVPALERGNLADAFGPRDVFDWIYAVLHSPIYRKRYAGALKSDFARIPIPKDRDTFAELVPLGRRLVTFHLLKPEEEPILKSPDIRFGGTGEARVEKGYPKYANGKVEINANRWFEDVPKETWDFHVGGYQVCDKWLKDRAGKGGKNPRPGRVLSDEDILHYRRVVTTLTETRAIMSQIDETIEKYGGWPGAFCIANDDCESEKA